MKKLIPGVCLVLLVSCKTGGDFDPIVIDLSGVRYLDSAFLSALVRLRRRLPHCPITLVVEAPSVRRIFELTEMHRLFQISQTAPPRLEE